MRHAPLFVMLLSGSLLCTACSHAAPDTESAHSSSVPDIPADSDTVDTVPDTDSAPAPSAGSAESQTEPEPAGLIPLPEISQPDYQGGDGGEEHAETPLPQYFTYRFFESGLSVRLAGGNYQSLSVDLSGMSPEDAESGYYLFDSDFDGDLDLSVPTVYTDSHKEFAVFRWDEASAHFAETPVMLSDPQYFPEEKHLTTLSQTETEAIVQDCVWQDDSLLTVLTAKLDLPDGLLAITQTNPDGSTEQSTEQLNTEQLTGKLMQYYNRKYASAASPAS